MLLLLMSGALGAGQGAPMRLDDYVPPIFADGPALGEPGFDRWLATQGLVKLPFTIWRHPRRVGAVGVHAARPAQVLRFTDGALGIALDERLREFCRDEDPCRLWLAGRFGDPLLPASDPAGVFGVQAVHGRVAGDGPHRAQSVRGTECLAIRALRPGHCARGPERCARCKAAEAQPASPSLLDLCPWGDYARPLIDVERAGSKAWRPYDVLQSFADAAEARAFAATHGIDDVRLDG